MKGSELFAELVSIVGGTMAQIRGGSPAEAKGLNPAIPEAKPQGMLFSLKMPTARGWSGGRTPVAAPGLKVNAFARGLKHPRSLYVLPNGDVLTAEALPTPWPTSDIMGYAVKVTMARAAAVGESANRISILRDADRDGVAEVQETFLAGLNQPFGVVLIGETLYVANTNELLAFPYKTGDLHVSGPAKKLMEFRTTGHWTRNLIVSKDQTRLYVAVGSQSNIGDEGMAVEDGRACIYEHVIATGESRIFAGGLRNPVGMAWEPTTNVLWTVVNERDGLGDETPPDYLTSVKDGAFYGWPYSYWNRIVDPRVPQDAAKVASSTQPDFALGGHTASLGLAWLPAGALPGFPEGMAIGQHGSWNRSKLSGYKLAFVPFANGKPTGEFRDILTGFLSPDERESYGRPVGVTLAADGGLLMADDVGNVIWRVTAA